MKKIFNRRLAAGFVVTAFGTLFATMALAAVLPSNAIVIAVRRGDCAALPESIHRIGFPTIRSAMRAHCAA